MPIVDELESQADDMDTEATDDRDQAATLIARARDLERDASVLRSQAVAQARQEEASVREAARARSTQNS